VGRPLWREVGSVHFGFCRASPAQPFSDMSPEIAVEVTLRPTVRQPVRLGALPFLEQVTRCYIYLSDNYFLHFSCRAPSLTRGRVCNLQWTDASSISSYISTDGLSVSSSWCRASNGAHNQILISLFDSYFVFSVYILPENRHWWRNWRVCYIRGSHSGDYVPTFRKKRTASNFGTE
jgi:hypothetical protein